MEINERFVARRTLAVLSVIAMIGAFLFAWGSSDIFWSVLGAMSQMCSALTLVAILLWVINKAF